MDIRIIEDVSPESKTGSAIENLIRTQLANEQSLEATLLQIGYNTGQTLLIGGFVAGELATMNAFMPQTFAREEDRILGYQSGFSATGFDHRGKGYWPKLMTASLDLLRSRGAGFVFGFPNPISHPLFERKLGFTTGPMWRVVLPTFIGRLGKFEASQSVGYYRPNLRELADFKQQADVNLIQVEADGCFAFGKIRRARGLRFLDIGGMTNEGGSFNNCIQLLCKTAKVSAFRYEANQASEFQRGFWPKRPSRPVILKALNNRLEIGDIGFVGGLADNY